MPLSVVLDKSATIHIWHYKCAKHMYIITKNNKCTCQKTCGFQCR